MRSILIITIMTILVSCNVIFIKEKVAFSKRFKIYHYTESNKNENDACNELMLIIAKIFKNDENASWSPDLNCMYYVDIKSSKKQQDRIRYTAFVDFDSFLNKLKDDGMMSYNIISVALVADNEIKSRIFDLYKGRGIILIDDSKKDIADLVCEITKKESIITTSAGEIYSLNLNLELIKGSKVIKSYVATGYGNRDDAVKSAVNELISKFDTFKDYIKVEYFMIEFSNVKTSDDIKNIYSFLKKNFVTYEVISISKSSIVLKLPLRSSIEEISSQIVANIKNSAIENIDIKNRKVSVLLNYTAMNIVL